MSKLESAKQNKHFLLRYIKLPKYTFVLFIGVLLAILVWWKFVVMSYLEAPMNINAKPIYYNFKEGSNLYTILKDLSKKGFITKPRYWLLYAKLNLDVHSLKSGIYKIEPKQSPISLLNALVAGNIAAFNLRTNEGNTFKQMLIGLLLEKRLNHNLLDRDPEKVMQQIGLSGKPYEGYFFPDTYNIPHNMTEVDFLKKSYQRMHKVLNKVWQNRDNNILLKNPHELLTLASIIEKEAGNLKEMPKISSVFHNRLQKKMRLQTDPTVIYGMGDSYHGNIRKKDLQTFTIFNTYKIKGLPPTPICIPSLAALKAAAHPITSDLLYFVSKGDGTHKFSKTHKEHINSVKKYQL